MSTPELKPATPITDAAEDEYRRGSNDWTIELNKAYGFARKLESALNAAREAITKAPHPFICAAREFRGAPIESNCNCWKAEALAQIDEALSPQQSKTT